MASVTFTIPDKIKDDMKDFLWVNWSELAKQEALRRTRLAKEFDEFRHIISKSKITEKDADSLAEKSRLTMHRQLKKERMI